MDSHIHRANSKLITCIISYLLIFTRSIKAFQNNTEFEGINDNTTVILIGTGSGTPDISFVLRSNVVNDIVGNQKLMSIEPRFLHDGHVEYVMGYRATLLISSNLTNCNGYLQSDQQGQVIVQQLLKFISLTENIIAHINQRMEEMINKNHPINNKNLNINKHKRNDTKCTPPIVGPDCWIGIEYDIQNDDCGFFTGTHQNENNCYAYGTDIATNTFPQPGRGSGQEWQSNTCKDMIAAAERDGLTYVGDTLIDYSYGPDDGHYLALYIWPNTNFHWARMDYNGTYNTSGVTNAKNAPRRWSHKPGATPVQIVDNNGNCIGDIAPCVLPSEADLSPWTEFCGYLIGIPSRLTIN